MAVESAEFIKDLNINSPAGTDPVSEGDDHIRLIKKVLQNSFGTSVLPKANLTMTEGDEWDEDAGYYKGRWNVWTPIGNMVPVANISESATSLTVDVMGSCGVAGYGTGHSLWMKLMKDDGTELAPAERIIGFNHVADTGNFEIYSGFSYRRIIESPPSGGFEFQINCEDPQHAASGAGCVIFNMTVTVTEYI